MYAVIKTGGKQYRVEPSDKLRVDKLAGEPGAMVDINEVLMVGEGDKTQVGAPMLDGASVKLEVLEQTRNDKIVVFKKKRRQNYRRTHGHKQEMTVVRVAEIADADGNKATAEAAKKPAKAAKKPAKAAKKPAKAAKKPAKAKAEKADAESDAPAADKE